MRYPVSCVLFATLFAVSSRAQLQSASTVEISPKTQWMYDSLRSIKNEVLFGYPNDGGRFRPMSRYEWGVSTNQLWLYLDRKFNSLIFKLDKERTLVINSKVDQLGEEQVLFYRQSLSQLLERKLAKESCFIKLNDLFEYFKPEIEELMKRPLQYDSTILMLPIRCQAISHNRKDNRSLNFVDPEKMKPDECTPSRSSQFRSTISKALNEETPISATCNSRFGFALLTLAAHRESANHIGEVRHEAMTKLVNEFRPELVYYFGVNIYQMKRELDAKR